MSSSLKKNSAGNEQLISVETTSLKDRLNRVYASRRSASPNSFDHLWDMKELALLEGKASVEVPRSWIDELDGALAETSTGH